MQKDGKEEVVSCLGLEGITLEVAEAFIGRCPRCATKQIQAPSISHPHRATAAAHAGELEHWLVWVLLPIFPLRLSLHLPCPSPFSTQIDLVDMAEDVGEDGDRYVIN